MPLSPGVGAALAGRLHAQPQQHLRWLLPLIGTAVALMLGMAYGYTAVLMIAALCYGIALAAMPRCETRLPVEE